jgi:RNA polymerase sigma-70 factor (ECF subfamily)
MVKTNYKKIPQSILIEMAQKDNFEALEELIRRIQKDIFSMYSHICKKREIAADLTQEALVKIAKNLEKLHDSKSFKTWSNRIALNLFYDFVRKDTKHTPPVSLDEVDKP